MKKALLFLFLSVLFSINSFAQERTVTGRITSPEDDLGLPGVTVMVKGTTNGTVTDMNGNYSLSGVSDSDSLAFSYVGFEPQIVISWCPKANQYFDAGGS